MECNCDVITHHSNYDHKIPYPDQSQKYIWYIYNHVSVTNSTAVSKRPEYIEVRLKNGIILQFAALLRVRRKPYFGGLTLTVHIRLAEGLGSGP